MSASHQQEMDLMDDPSQHETQSKTLLGSTKQKMLNMEHTEQDVVSQTKSGNLNTVQAQDNVTAPVTAISNKETAKKTKKSKPAYLQSLNEQEKQANFKIIEKMNKKISFLKNPRYRVNKSPIIMTDAMKNQAALEVESIKNSSFRVEPPSLSFVDYEVNGVYELPLKITNVSGIIKRIKFIPPVTDNFTVKYFKYPSNVTGDIAPGMSLNMTIAFQAPSFADFDDIITFVSEESSFKIPMRARRDPPQISLTNPMDCMNSWIGDRVDMAFRCLNTGGDGGFKFFCEKDEDDSKQTDADSIKIGSFTLSPSEFYLYSGSAIDIYVSFNPEREGRLEENLILACDNQTSEFYKLSGYGAMMDLDVIAVDGKEVNFKENPFETVYFDNTNPTSESKRVIRVKNNSPIMVPYHWSVFKQRNTQKITLENEDCHYRVSPSQGKIQGGQYIDFELYFRPDHAEPYFEFADLIIEDIPISSVRNPPEGLKNFAQANTVKNAKVPMPTYVGSNTQFLSIPMLSFNLRGQGNSCKVEVEPSYCQFEGDTYINHEYSRTVSLKKRSEGQVKYELRLEGKNKESFQIDVKSQGFSLLEQPDGVIRSVIQADEDQIELEIVLRSNERGKCMAYFYIEIEDGAPVSFQVTSEFMGPIVRCFTPIIDYSLIKVNSSESLEIVVENQSPIPANVLFKKSENEKLNFLNMMTHEQASTMGDNFDSGQQALIYNQPFITKEGNTVQFDQYSLQLEPFQKQTIEVQLRTKCEEHVKEYFEIMVEDGQSSFFNLTANIESPKVQLNRLVMNLGRIYAGVPEYVNPQSKHQKSSIVMKNYGNLPAYFKWENINDPEKVVAQFEPQYGVVHPRSEIKIKMMVTVFTGGNLNELFLCDIKDMEMPIGFEMHADAYGLNVSYETQEDVSNQVMNTSHSTMRTKVSDRSNTNTKNLLTNLNFPHCLINKTSSQKFILKNLSGIKTNFEFDIKYFAPLFKEAQKEKSELEKAKEEAEKRAAEQKSLEQQLSPSGKPKKKVGFVNQGSHFGGTSSSFDKMRTRPILSDEHEKNKFSSAVGETFTKTKQLEKDMSFFLSNNKGIAVVFNPHSGELPPNSEIPITVTVYNNVCGKFDDVITSQVKGLPLVEFPIAISITGSPVRIPPNQVGINYNTEPATLPIPTVVAKTKKVTKTFIIKNTGIKGVNIDWKIFDQKKPYMIEKDKLDAQIRESIHGSQNINPVNDDSDDDTNDIFNIDIVKNMAYDKNTVPYKFDYSVIEPEPSYDSAFEIQPSSCVVGSRSTKEFSVTFDPSKGTGNFQSIILASPELSAEELEVQATTNPGGLDIVKKGSLGIISMILDATTIDPILSIDRKLKMDNENHLRFKYWSIQNQDAPPKTQKLTFTNTSKADLTFILNANGPFEIVKTKTNSGATHPLSGQNNGPSTETSLVKAKSSNKVLKQKAETMFCLQPLKIVEVSLKFKSPPVADTAEWPMTIFNERQGELIANFNNGDSQKLIIDAVLMRPRVVILTDFLSKNDYAMDELDFGTVNVERDRTIHVYLSNTTDVTARWQLNYVKFPRKQTIGHNTTTKWEHENLEKTDDAEVFEFSATNGELKGTSLRLRKVPEGGLVPPVPKDEDEQKYLPQKIFVKFKPKVNVLYKSKFRFTCENGLSCDVILKGRGSYEENHD